MPAHDDTLAGKRARRNWQWSRRCAHRDMPHTRHVGCIEFPGCRPKRLLALIPVVGFDVAIALGVGRVCFGPPQGHSMNTTLLRGSFQSLFGPAKQILAQYLLQIQHTATTLDMGQIMSLVKGT